MLSCKKCGAQMSGVDLVCKKCGTPWGKTHKSRTSLYFEIFLIILVFAIAYIYFNKDVYNPFMNYLSSIFVKQETKPEETEPIKKPVETKPVEEKPEENGNIVTPPAEPVEPVVPDTTPTEPLPPTFTWISASSQLSSQGKFTYGPDLTVDGDFSTAWLEGAKGDGIGEWITYSAEQDQTLSSITLYNGYLKNNITYTNNGRIKKLSIELSDGTIIAKEIPKSTFADSKKGFKISLGEPVKTAFVKITILDVYTGAYYKDTALSGISFE